MPQTADWENSEEQLGRQNDYGMKRMTYYNGDAASLHIKLLTFPRDIVKAIQDLNLRLLLLLQTAKCRHFIEQQRGFVSCRLLASMALLIAEWMRSCWLGRWKWKLS